MSKTQIDKEKELEAVEAKLKAKFGDSMVFVKYEKGMDVNKALKERKDEINIPKRKQALLKQIDGIEKGDRIQVLHSYDSYDGDGMIFDMCIDGSDGSLEDFQKWVPEAIFAHRDIGELEKERIRAVANSIRDITVLCKLLILYNVPFGTYGDW